MENKVVVIGGSGFIGSYFARTSDYPVTILSRSAPAFNKPNIRFIPSDLTNRDTLKTALSDCKWVIHCASTSTPGQNLQNPTVEATENLLPTLTLLEVLHQLPAVNMIYLSTGGAMYGNTPEKVGGFTESSNCHPISNYAAGKAAAEMFIQAFGHQSPRKVFIVRPSNMYGPGQPFNPRFGLIPALFNAAMTKTPFSVWGDGETVRDFLYIDDFCALLNRLMTAIHLPEGVTTLNAGSGRGYSINDVIRVVEKVVDIPLVVQRRERRTVDVDRIILDSSLAKTLLGWEPTTSLEEGLRKTFRALNSGLGGTQP
jgi:UDP-glucose 4-epimerase